MLAALKIWPTQNLAQAGSLLTCDDPNIFEYSHSNPSTHCTTGYTFLLSKRRYHHGALLRSLCATTTITIDLILMDEVLRIYTYRVR
jgi:hypothetical protein